MLGARVRPIFASQFASGYYGNALMWSKRTWGNNDWLHGLACAPYIWAAEGTVDQMLATLTADYKTREAAGSKLAQMRALCDAHLKNNNLFFYEVGIDTGQGELNLTARNALAIDPRMEQLTYDFMKSNFAWGGVKGAAYFNGCSASDKWGQWGLCEDASVPATFPKYRGAAKFVVEAAPTGGVAAKFFKNTDFTVLLEEKVVPLVNHAWVAWATAPLHAGQNPTWTEGKDGSIRFTGKYIPAAGVTKLVAECEANDTTLLAVTGSFAVGTPVPFTLDYVGRFAGNGSCYVQLLEQFSDGTKCLVTQERLLPT